MVTWDIQFGSLVLVFTFLVLGLIWYVQFLWNRRNLYIYSWNVPGPFAFPLIGAAYLFTGSLISIYRVCHEDLLLTVSKELSTHAGIMKICIDNFNCFMKLQKKFPGLCKLWFGPMLVYIVGEPEHIRMILTNSKCLEKNFFYKTITSFVGPGILTAPIAKWKKHRKLLNPSFNQNILDSFVKVFAEQSNVLTQQLLKNVGKKHFDLYTDVFKCTLDIIFQNTLGAKLNIQTTDNVFAASFSRVLEIVVIKMFTIWQYMEFAWKLFPMSRELEKHANMFRGVLVPVIQRKIKEFRLRGEATASLQLTEIEEGTKRRRIFDMILGRLDFTEDDIIQDTEVFVIAGSDTTAATMCFVFEILGMFQDIQQKVYEEVMEVVGEDRDVAPSDLPNLKYAERVIKETLRLFPTIPVFFRMLGEDTDLEIMKSIMKWQRKYSSLMKMWLGPHLVYVVGEPEYIRTILMHPNCIDKNFIYDPMTSLVGTGLLTAPAEKWKKHRKILNPSFSQQILNSFVEVFAAQSNILTKQLLKNEFDLFFILSRCTLDMIWENAMGIKFNVQTTDNPFATSVERIMEITIVRMFTIWLHPNFIWKFHPLKREADKHLKICRDVEIPVIRKRIEEFGLKKEANALLTAQIEEDTKKKNLALLDMILECSNFTEDEIRDEIEVFAIAGSETSASTMCFIFEMLGMYQNVQQKVYEEVIEILGEDRDVTASDLPNLKYTEMVIKETLRLFPTVPLFLRSLGEDVDLGETILPAGASTFFIPIQVHRDAKYWPDPLRFDPDRFLPEEVAKRHPGAYFPFSLGARNCIGAKYAMMNIKTMLATVLRKYKIFTEYKTVEEIRLDLHIVLRLIDGSKAFLEVR